MKINALSFVALVCVSGSQFASAVDGSIDFNGERVSQTCTIAVDGVVSPAVATVTLPTTSTSLLEVAGNAVDTPVSQPLAVDGLKSAPGAAQVEFNAINNYGVLMPMQQRLKF